MRSVMTCTSLAKWPGKTQIRATAPRPRALPREESTCTQEALGNLEGSTWTDTGGGVGTGCTMEVYSVRAAQVLLRPVAVAAAHVADGAVVAAQLLVGAVSPLQCCWSHW